MMSVSDIEQKLRDRCEGLVRELLPAARQEGPYLKIGNIHGDAGGSLVVWLTGPKQGKWTDFAADEHGDMLDMIAQVHGFHGKGDAVAWAKQWLGIVDSWSPRDAVRPDPAEQARRAQVARDALAAREAEDAKLRAAKIKRAKGLYLSAVALADTPVEAYFRNRGLVLPAGSIWPNSLRFHSECWHSDLRDKIPAMIGAIYLPTGEQVAVHRTYLGQHRDGRWLSADRVYPEISREARKKVDGPMWGGFIPIAKGASGKSMAQMPEGEPVYMAEGIEKCIAIRIAKPDARIVCAVSLGNMGAIAFPEQVGQLVFVCDRDDKTKAVDALDRSIARQQARGLDVRLVMPPPPFKDIDEWLTAVPSGPSPNAGVSGGPAPQRQFA